ncbi:MAG: carbohydrate kinase family protein [Calditrichales bacterium]|nr:MAG: carbohydrate kinase family protein [Calditrichales bacterium]
MDQNADIVVVGELNVDIILNQIDGFAEVGKEKLANEMTLTLGGSSAIIASNLSSLGSRVSFLGKIGKDVFADLIIKALESNGVLTNMVIQDPILKTGATVILNYDEDRAMVTHTGAMAHLTIADISEEKLCGARHMHFSSYFLQPGLKKDIGEMFKMARSLGLTTSLDAQWDPNEKWDLDLESVLPYVNVFLPNKVELLYLTGKKSVDAAFDYLADFANIVVVKMGNEGSLSFSGGKKHIQKAFLNKNVVDAIGAGDSFNAGFIHQFIRGFSVEKCQEFGNLTGAVSTTAAGGTQVFADYQEFIRVAKDRFGYQVQMP